MVRHHDSPDWAWFAGRPVPFAEARLPLDDRGLLFGESVYEIVALRGGVPFELEAHVERMRAGAAVLGLDDDVPALDEWNHIVQALHRKEPHPTALLYAQLTGGSAPRQHVRPLDARALFFAYTLEHDFPAPMDMSRGVAAVTRPDQRWQRSDVKLTGLVPAVLALTEAQRVDAHEVVFVGKDGFLADGARSSVFLVAHRSVATPSPSRRTLDGTSAQVVRRICADLGIAFERRPLTLSDLHAAEEVFLASTSRLVSPVVRLDDRPVTDGKPGTVSLQIAYHFHRLFWEGHRPVV